MISKRAATTVLLCAAMALAATVSVADWAATFRPLATSVLRMESMDDSGNRGVCSSAVINRPRGFVLTAAHCVPSGERVSMTVNERDAVLIKRNALLDLAILRVSHMKNETEVSLAPSAPEAGASVAVVGFAFGAPHLKIQVGVVSDPLDQDSRRMWIDAVMIPGDSGGVVVDSEGRLVGVTSAVLFPSDSFQAAHIGMAVPFEHVLDFIEDYISPATKAARQ
jgi:S1-C subfamily serine protease